MRRFSPKWRTLVAAFAALVAFTTPTYLTAQSLDSRIYVLNQERLFSQSNFGVRVRDEILARSAALAAENKLLEDELKAEELALTETRPTLSPTEFRTLADAFDEKVESLRTGQAHKSAELNAWAEAEKSRFFEAASPLLVSLAEEIGALAILDRRSVIIAADQLDITGAAIERVNADIGDGTVPAQE